MFYTFLNVDYHSSYENIKHKKSLKFPWSFENWVEDGARTRDPRYHKPML